MATCLIRSIAIIVVLGGCVWMARLADINRRAPIVVSDAVGCFRSPGGRYLGFYRLNNPQAEFFDTINQAIVTVPLLPEMQEVKALWWREETYFYYTTWEDYYDSESRYQAPTNGWLIDVATQTITDIRILSLDLQRDILTEAKAASKSQWTSLQYTSPDGRFRYLDAGGPAASIVLVNDYEVKLNTIDGVGYIHSCIPGWRSDSNGYYFLDTPPYTARNGLIRLLLANPPPPYWPIAWLLLGGLLTAVILSYRWIDQRIVQWRRRS